MVNIRLYGFTFAICSCFIGIPGFSAYNAADDTTLRLYFRNNSSVQVNAIDASQLVPYLNLTEKTLIHCHGYEQSTDTKTVDSLVQDLLDGFTYNIIAADYRKVSMKNYVSAVVMANDVANVIANSITDMKDAGVGEEQFKLLGFSLGGQIVGIVGRTLNFTIQEIIAMDPAGPLFEFGKNSISASDAACVKCIHTDMGFYGTSHTCGHLDFYPNGGTREQYGCKLFSVEDLTNSCSHGRAQIYMGESAIDPYGFLSVKCDSWHDFKAGKCKNSLIIPMGEAAPCNVTGKFYLRTNPSYPYALGYAATS